MRLIARVLLPLWLVVLLGAVTTRSAAAADPCAPPVQRIACENTRAGVDRTSWDPGGQADSSIVGFSDGFTFNVGDPVPFKIQTAAAAYRIEVYRLGWYGGRGSRLVSTIAPSVSLPQAQPTCARDGGVGLLDCGTWNVSTTWRPPSDAITGVYVARLVRSDTGGANLITFVVRDDAARSAVVMQTSDTTWQAYNRWGGQSLYTSTSGGGRAYKVSYNRPIDSRTSCCPSAYVFGMEYPMIRYLERNGYDVSYISGIDSHRDRASLLTHKVFISVGHDEYWSGQQRSNIEAARDAGVHLMFLAGNDMYWRTRWEPSIDGRNQSERTLVTYKETLADGKIDPSSEWTGTWRDPRFTDERRSHTPENALIGTQYKVDCCASAITVPADQSRMRFWRNTPLANSSGLTTLADQTLGFEWNSDEDNGFRPAGLVRLSTTTRSSDRISTEFGRSIAPGIATHHLTLYRAPSGALVFSAGSMQFVWGLDDSHDPPSSPTDPNLQQAMVNLFADMGVQPNTLMPGLTPAQASSDATAPSATVATGSQTVAYGAAVPVSGSAVDVGGRVAGVEVSFDGGVRWYVATGTTAWSLTWNANRSGAQPLLIRAVDDSGNLSAPISGPVITVSCPCGIFDSGDTPEVAVSTDTGTLEAGVKFQTQLDGTISAVRVYRGAVGSGSRTGTIWSATGDALAEATVANNAQTGWQDIVFSSPIRVSANTTYVASVFFPSGGYAYSANDFYLYGRTTSSSPVVGLANGVDGPNGVFRYGGHVFPVNTNRASNYWVDVAFAPDGGSAPPTTTVPPPPTPTTVPVASGCPCSMFGSTVPVNASASDVNAVELGTKFRVTSPMVASGVRFYKGPANGGTHRGRLWSSSGQMLSEVVFTGESASGWQSARFASPVALLANTTYVVSVFMPSGGYAFAVGAFTSVGAGVPPVQALANGVDGPNGVFVYGTTGGFPTATYAATNYFVDVTVENSGTTPTTTPTTTAPPTTTVPPPPTTTVPASSATIFGPTDLPAVASATDAAALTVGVKFQVASPGVVTGVRFFKGARNTGTHTGTLWNSAGAILASGTFTNESASGWQELTFLSPVALQPGVTYVAGVFMPVGGYAFTLSGYGAAGAGTTGVVAWRDGLDGPNGVFQYATSPAFPNRGFLGTNYWVDVRFRVGS